MMVRILPTIKRFWDGTAGVVAPFSSGEHGRSRRGDFMSCDLTGSARFYGR